MVREKSHSYLDRRELSKQFKWIANSSYQDVPGVWCVASGRPGPILGITLHTHGNEPSGLAVLSHFRNQVRIEDVLTRGTVIFVLNNIRATKRYIGARTKEKRGKCRFCDVNMNRLPSNLRTSTADRRYEVQRARALLPVWKEFEFAIDVHSFSQEAEPFIISIGRLYPKLVRGFPISNIVSRIDEVMRQKPAVAYYGQGSVRALAIESGYHEDPKALRRAITCVTALMKNLRMMRGSPPKSQRVYSEYVLREAVWFNNRSQRLIRPFKPYEKIRKGEVLAIDKGAKITAASDGHVILPIRSIKPSRISEEIMFLSEPVRLRRTP